MRRFLLATAVVLLSAVLGATVVIPIEFRELVTTSPVILHGRVTDARSAFVDERRSVETFVTVTVDEYLKGNLGDHVTFMVPGGEIGRYRTVFVGAPEFHEGDEVVLFLKTPAGRLPFVVGLSQGVFRVLPDASSGRRMVTTPIVMGRASGDAEPIVRGAVTRQPLPIESFRDAVRQVIAEAVRQ